jgi:hypothetical protein
MSTQHETITAEMSLRLVLPGQTPVPVWAQLCYEMADPYAVHVTFRTGGEERPEETVAWTFARDLLAEGVGRGAGEGDVRVWPAGSGSAAVVFLSLSSPHGRALFEVPLGELVGFLTGTYAAIPRGQESAFLDLDTELERLFHQGGNAAL